MYDKLWSVYVFESASVLTYTLPTILLFCFKKTELCYFAWRTEFQQPEL